MATAEIDIALGGVLGRLDDAIASGEIPEEILIVGAAGTGKTFGILLLLHLLSLKRPGMRILVCRKTREALTESVLVTYEREVLPITGHSEIADGCKRRVRQAYTYPNGTEWIVGGLDKASKILSTSYDIAFINEAIEVEEEDWETVRSRIGRPDRAHDLNCLIGDTNPGIPNHWLKRRCDRGLCQEWVSIHKDNPALWDRLDKCWTPAGQSYLDRLSSLTGSRYRRLFLGLWTAGEGQWFETFGDRHVSEDADFNPNFPVHLAIDSGVHTGAVWFQVRWIGRDPQITVFSDYYCFNKPAYDVASDLLEITGGIGVGRSRGRLDRVVTDPAGKSSTAIGPTVLGEYSRAGLNPGAWPSFPGSVLDGLGLIESFVSVDPPALLVHPRCGHMISAFHNYLRAKRQGQWIDNPEDPQHPHEDLMDALRGGLQDKFPDGRRPDRKFRMVHASGIF